MTRFPFNPQLRTIQRSDLGNQRTQPVTIYSRTLAANGQTSLHSGPTNGHTVTSNNVGTQSQNLNLYSATVVVTYSYRGKLSRAAECDARLGRMTETVDGMVRAGGFTLVEVLSRDGGQRPASV